MTGQMDGVLMRVEPIRGVLEIGDMFTVAGLKMGVDGRLVACAPGEESVMRVAGKTNAQFFKIKGP